MTLNLLITPTSVSHIRHRTLAHPYWKLRGWVSSGGNPSAGSATWQHLVLQSPLKHAASSSQQTGTCILKGNGVNMPSEAQTTQHMTMDFFLYHLHRTFLTNHKLHTNEMHCIFFSIFYSSIKKSEKKWI